MLSIYRMRRFFVLALVLILSGCKDRSNWGIANELVNEFEINMMREGLCRDKADCQKQQSIFVAPYTNLMNGDKGLSFDVYNVSNEKVMALFYGACLREYKIKNGKIGFKVFFYSESRERSTKWGWFSSGKVFSSFELKQVN